MLLGANGQFGDDFVTPFFCLSNHTLSRSMVFYQPISIKDDSTPSKWVELTQLSVITQKTEYSYDLMDTRAGWVGQ